MRRTHDIRCSQCRCSTAKYAGKVAYYFKGIGELPNFKALKMRITADEPMNSTDVTVRYECLLVGGFPRLVPYAQIDDGKIRFINCA